MNAFTRAAFDTNDLTVAISELLVATADGGDADVDRAVPDVLRLLRQSLKMDVVFVSEFVNGERVFRFVEKGIGAPPIEVGDAGPLEESYCQRVVDGRMPESVADASTLAGLPATDIRVGAHLSTPIRLSDGSTYGTLCCFSGEANPNLQKRDLDNLRNCAKVLARRIETSLREKRESSIVNWRLLPIEPVRR